MTKPLLFLAMACCFAAPLFSAETTSNSTVLPATPSSAPTNAVNTQANNPPAASQNAQMFTPAQLEQILAPIALYPDTLLTHILIAATYPLEVVAAERWLSKHSELSPQQIIEQGELQDWDPSVMALLPFKDILTRMSEDLHWTQQLGDAFLDNQAQVLASIQSLRQKADDAGNLDQLSNVDVSKEQQNIIIEPTNTQVVYVPYYDTRVVYGIWAWPYYPPVYWHHYHPHRYATYYGPIYYTPPVYITFGWFYGGVHWHSRHVVIHNSHSSYYSHHYKKHYGHKKYAKHHGHKGKGKHPWQHNPKHRKGVAYQNKKTADRYGSNRPTSQYSKRIRNEERDFTAPRYHGKPLPGHSGKGKGKGKNKGNDYAQQTKPIAGKNQGKGTPPGKAKKPTRTAQQSTQLKQRNKQFQQELQRERYRGNDTKNNINPDSRIIRVAKQPQLTQLNKPATKPTTKPATNNAQGQASRAQQLKQQLQASSTARQNQQTAKLQKRQVNNPKAQQRPQTKQYGLNEVNKRLAQGNSFNQLEQKNIGKTQHQNLPSRKHVQMPTQTRSRQIQPRVQTPQPTIKTAQPRAQTPQPRMQRTQPRMQPKTRAPQRSSQPTTRRKH